MDVAPILGVNHVKSASYVLRECDCTCLLLLVTMHMMLVAVVNVCIVQLMIMQDDRDKLKYSSKLFKDSFTSVSNDHLITI